VVQEAFSMIEPIMFVGIGFLVASLLVIGVIPLVHARAERLTARRLEALTPLSMAEIQADKDQLRAEFAMSTRRLEMSVEQLKAKTTNQLTEIGKKSDAIGRLKLELGEKTAALFALEAKERQLADELHSLQGDIASKGGTLADVERELVRTRAELTQVAANFHESSATANTQRVELVALRAQAEALKGQIESYEQETWDLQDRLRAKTDEVRSLSEELGEERGRAEQLGARVGQLDRQLIAQMTESEVLGRRVEELTARLDEQGRFLADREFVSDRLHTEATNAQRIGSKVRAALADAENRHRVATEAIRAEKASIAAQLEQSQDERVKLQREIAAMKHDAENSGANERVENALLRERINDIAAEVARLTATLEGPASPIASILNSDAGHSDGAPNGSNGASLSIAPRIGESKGTLADRIRALQSRASQIPRRAAPRA
jgi:DNA repair exonuclease SbcCD ATPase subunit